MDPMPKPGSYRPIFYAQETERGHWQWILYKGHDHQPKRTMGTYKNLVTTVMLMTDLRPQPFLLFRFAEGQNCSELNKAREGIARAGKCSKNSVHCIEGTLPELLATR